MKKEIIFILLFIFNLSFAHTDVTARDTCGNTSIYMKSAFKYAEFNKTKVIVQIIDKVAKELKFNDKIEIEYKHQLMSYYSEKDKIEIEYSKFRKENYLKIRIIGNSIDIEKLIKLVVYSVDKENALNSTKTKLLFYDVKTKELTSTLIELDSKLIETIESKSLNKKFVDLLKSKVEIFSNEVFHCYWLNKKYYYLKKDKIETLYSIEDNLLFSNQLTDLGFVIFPSNSQFFFINNNGEILKNHSLENINNNKVFYFFERGNNFYVTSDREIGYYYLPDLDKLLKEVN